MTLTHSQGRAEQVLFDAGILPVVTIHTLDQAHAVAEALLAGGLNTIELTLRTPVAIQALTQIKRAFPDVVIGAGTVTTVEQMQQAIDAGSDFLVTPGTPEHLAEALATAPLPVIPGAATPTELLALAAHGFRICKLFPASVVGGLEMIKSLAAPLADLKLCPTGGINASNAIDYLRQKNVACIGGSWMVRNEWIAEGKWDAVQAAAAEAAALVQQVRSAT